MHREFAFVLSLPDYVKHITQKYGSIRWCDEQRSIVFSFKEEYLLRAFISFAKDYDLSSHPAFQGTNVLYEVAEHYPQG